MDPIVPTPEQIASAVACAKAKIAAADIPGFIRPMITDALIESNVTDILTAGFNPREATS
jgi:hypothetical protein